VDTGGLGTVVLSSSCTLESTVNVEDPDGTGKSLRILRDPALAGEEVVITFAKGASFFVGTQGGSLEIVGITLGCAGDKNDAMVVTGCNMGCEGVPRFTIRDGAFRRKTDESPGPGCAFVAQAHYHIDKNQIAIVNTPFDPQNINLTDTSSTRYGFTNDAMCQPCPYPYSGCNEGECGGGDSKSGWQGVVADCSSNLCSSGFQCLPESDSRINNLAVKCIATPRVAKAESASPSSVKGGEIITVTGGQFPQDNSVLVSLNGAPLPAGSMVQVHDNGTRLTFKSPPVSDAKYRVNVVVTALKGPVSSSETITYTYEFPQITQALPIKPNDAFGTLEVRGSNFAVAAPDEIRIFTEDDSDANSRVDCLNPVRVSAEKLICDYPVPSHASGCTRKQVQVSFGRAAEPPFTTSSLENPVYVCYGTRKAPVNVRVLPSAATHGSATITWTNPSTLPGLMPAAYVIRLSTSEDMSSFTDFRLFDPSLSQFDVNLEQFRDRRQHAPAFLPDALEYMALFAQIGRLDEDDRGTLNTSVPTLWSSVSTRWTIAQDCGAHAFLDLQNITLDPTQWRCRECPRGADCAGLPTSRTLMALFGHARCGGPNSMMMFERCLFAGACLGGPNPALQGKFLAQLDEEDDRWSDLSLCNPSYATDMDYDPRLRNCSESCSPGYLQGSLMCSSCAEGFSLSGLSGKCAVCPSLGVNIVVATGGLIAGALALFVFVKLTLSDAGDVKGQDAVKTILATYVQILAMLSALQIPWPEIFTDIFGFGAAVTSLGEHYVNLKCLHPALSEGDVFFMTRTAWGLAPIVILGGCLLGWEIGNRCKTGGIVGLARKRKASLVGLCFLLFPSLCTATFSIFACHKQCDEQISRLRADSAVICGEEKHLLFELLLGVPMLVLFVMGLPIAGGLLIRRARTRANVTDANKRQNAMNGGAEQDQVKAYAATESHPPDSMSAEDHFVFGLLCSCYREECWWCVFSFLFSFSFRGGMIVPSLLFFSNSSPTPTYC
jgi:hypothetical protein